MSLQLPPTAVDFQVFASVLFMDYEGPGVETAGQAASTFRMCSRTLPSYPASVPVQERDTFWRWQKDETNCDLMIASQTTILNSLLYAAGGNPDSVDAVNIQHIEDLSAKLRSILRQNVQQNVTFQDPFSDQPHAFIEKWLKLLRDDNTAWPAGCAKPVNLNDYQSLGLLMRMGYFGAPVPCSASDEPLLDKNAPGKTVFSHSVLG